MLTEVIKCQTRKEVQEHFSTDVAPPIIPIDDSEGEEDITWLVMISIKWAADLVENKSTPYFFLKYIEEQTKDWVEAKGDYQDCLVAWVLVACTANKKLMVNYVRNFTPLARYRWEYRSVGGLVGGKTLTNYRGEDSYRCCNYRDGRGEFAPNFQLANTTHSATYDK